MEKNAKILQLSQSKQYELKNWKKYWHTNVLKNTLW